MSTEGPAITPRAESLPEAGAGDHPALARALLREALTASSPRWTRQAGILSCRW
ncbi:hypothetical protein ACFQU7_23485 [Pseudoroseomonas wenyumeiae]